jgi:cob(I)alamin adenosyltransferase
VSEQQHQLGELHVRLAQIVETLEASEQPSTDDLLQTMEATSMAIKLTRIYTRGGDDGKTSLGNTKRVSKTHPIVDAGGTVDELNSHIGLALATGQVEQPHAERLRQVQNELFDLGADLTVPVAEPGMKPRLRLSGDYVARLEEWCDEVNATLEPLSSFILPGGSLGSAQLHVTRSVCRRAERRVLEIDGVNPEVLHYLNRLSDLLFVLARAAAGEQELWQPALTQTA